MDRYRKNDRCSSITSMSPVKCRDQRLDRYRLKRRSRRSDDDDDFASRHSQNHHHCRRASLSERRSSDSIDSERHKPSRLDRYRVKRRSRSSDDDDDFASRHSQNHHHRRRASRSKRKRSYDSIDSEHHKSSIRKNGKKSEFWEDRSNCRSSSKHFPDSKYFYYKSEKYLKDGRLKKSLKFINIAIALKRKKDKFMSELYSRRGTIYTLLEKPRCSFQGFLDYERAFMLDKGNFDARRKMSKILFMGANKYYRKKQYKAAIIALKHALKLDVKNGEAAVLIKVVKKKLLEKVTTQTSTRKDSETSVPEKRRNPEIASPNETEHVRRVLAEIHSLYELTVEAVTDYNYPRALIRVNNALRLSNDVQTDDNVFRNLSILKQKIMNIHESFASGGTIQEKMK